VLAGTTGGKKTDFILIAETAATTCRTAFSRREMSLQLLDLRSIARALGGDVVGAQALCPRPGHSKRDRSLSVKFSTTRSCRHL
jgi:hypothetical protein